MPASATSHSTVASNSPTFTRKQVYLHSQNDSPSSPFYRMQFFCDFLIVPAGLPTHDYPQVIDFPLPHI
jgi:hypothetical protein